MPPAKRASTAKKSAPAKKPALKKKSAAAKAPAKKAVAKKPAKVVAAKKPAKVVAAKKPAKVVAAKSSKAAAKRKPAKAAAKKVVAPKPVVAKPAAAKPAAAKPAAAKPAAAKPAAAKSAAAKPVAAKPPAAEARAPAKKWGKRADLGAPIDAFFLKQPPQLRPVLEELRRMVLQAAPDAESSIKWGMPFFTVNGTMMCALGAHKSHVNLILSGPPGTYADPDGRLAGDGKTGRHLKLTALDELPADSVRTWLRTAAALARKG